LTHPVCSRTGHVEGGGFEENIVLAHLYRAYYQLKPYLPWRLRIALRRHLIRRLRSRFGYAWPIDENAGKPPSGWCGWPDGKRFALVLTHDVEGKAGYEKCRPLMQLESALGFRSSFNFVPEGNYSADPHLRHLLAEEGFEVGIHDLRHDGRLYSSRRDFAEQAQLINRYLRDWQAVGFRSAFMHHNLEWIKSLEVSYDSSTFDTDPFEPQPDGVGTIFPFWVPRADGSGYVELPYTLPQDFSLFVIHQEAGIDIWRRKLDWIAERGGMALLNVHPDYVHFADGAAPAGEYPESHYRSFLEYVKTRYGGTYWHPLPRIMAQFVADQVHARPLAATGKQSRTPADFAQPKKLWIDLDNTPHVPFFRPIIRKLEERGYSVFLTGRDAFQVCELAAKKDLKLLQIGRHHGKNRAIKLVGLHYRALQLAPHIARRRPVLGISHGSRAQILACKMLKIPSVLIGDYEHATFIPWEKPSWIIAPEIIPDRDLFRCPGNRICKYPGIKENVYVPDFEPDPSLLEILGLNRDAIIITIRPPATEAHYHNPESEVLLSRLMARLLGTPGIQIVMLPRNAHQSQQLRTAHPEWFADGKVIIPPHAIDGLNLIFYSDLVVSGGGTMNRESAALGVPAYSIFRGKIGAVDRYLQALGRLILIESMDDIDGKIEIKHRDRRYEKLPDTRRSLEAIVSHIEQMYEEASHAP